MLVQLAYASLAAPDAAAAVGAILASGRRHNQQLGISGVLCSGFGMYLQVMEGERAAVSQTYAQLLQDARHQQAQLLYCEEISERQFANWPLGHVKLEKLGTPFLLKYAERLPLTPGQLSAPSVRAMLLDLVATAAIAHK
ncbi:blue light sensor protein [Vandammella animalimorsus]|uniref:Blue light sensor protein n=1 Tax=Vandammella animalimorsus TaxID=2029117 RepID=A0A2A2AQV3_9BURK|nr:BLUF domain-containing protein [Vandammella animalimorsus]PAT40216.1 blue light sensor protein [Vandammella animalimorsus]